MQAQAQAQVQVQVVQVLELLLLEEERLVPILLHIPLDRWVDHPLLPP